jgi:S-adenosylhomocysteine hydrolase
VARKNATFEIVVHVPDNLDRKRMQAAFDGFYVAQVKRTLEQSNLDKAGKIEALNRVIAHYPKGKRKSA